MCQAEVAAMSSDARVVDEGQYSSRGLGLLWIVYGILRLLIGLWMITFTPVATVMFGALLARVSDVYSLMSEFHIFYAFAIALSLVCGVVGLLAGIGLLLGWGSGRVLAIVAGFLALSELPLGITLGVYTLLKLFPVRAARA
jgi:hypothetical protein